ncbi:MAG: PTS sugar transporter subunit IIA [Spirochaetales bacterium]|nr:PTS sugar transporter subunit IIA [Spirochaetales bacterium]
MGFIDYIVNEKSVIANLEVTSWEDAVIKGGALMVEKGISTPGYLDTIVKKCKDNGPYIVIAPGIAMPHARPEEGALKLGYSLVTLKEGVNFGEPDNDPIRLLIYLAAPSVKEHNEEAICQIADLCDDEPVIEKIINAGSESEIIEILEGL